MAQSTSLHQGHVSKISASATTFLIDQLAHIATAVVLAMVLTANSYTYFIGLMRISEAFRVKLLIGAIVYVGVIFGGGYCIRYVTRGLTTGISSEPLGQLRNAGLYIGWIERFLVITAIAIQSPALVGLILTGKSIARFPELKEARFAEYFLIGTLLSMAIALTGGLILGQSHIYCNVASLVDVPPFLTEWRHQDRLFLLH
jgi:hypothetical protein